MAKCKTCGAPVNLAPDGDPRYKAPRAAAALTAPASEEVERVCGETERLASDPAWENIRASDLASLCRRLDARVRELEAERDRSILSRTESIRTLLDAGIIAFDTVTTGIGKLAAERDRLWAELAAREGKE